MEVGPLAAHSTVLPDLMIVLQLWGVFQGWVAFVLVDP